MEGPPFLLFLSPAREDKPLAGPSSCLSLHTDGWAVGTNIPQAEKGRSPAGADAVILRLNFLRFSELLDTGLALASCDL